jgi:integrase
MTKRRDKGTGTYIQRGRNSWLLKIDAGKDPKTGKRRTLYKTVKGTKSHAVNSLTQWASEIRQPDYIEPSKATLKEYLEEKWLPFRKDGAKAVTPKTYERYNGICQHINRYLGNVKLSNLRSEDIDQYLKDCLTSGGAKSTPLASQTVKHHYRVLFSALKQAVRWNRIPRNPMENVDPPVVKKKKVIPLEPSDVSKLIAGIKGTEFELPAALALATGMRLGEVLGLHWTEVDLEKREIKVIQTIEQTKEGIRLKEPKSNAGYRRIKLPKVTVNALRGFKTKQMRDRLKFRMAWDPKGPVFSNPAGELTIPRNFTNAFSRTATKAGLKGGHFHLLRHTHASQLIKDGVNIKTVSSRLGHSSIVVTLDVYSHLMAEMDNAAADAIDAVYGGILGTPS